MQTYIESKKLRRVVIRLQKAHSSFFYFIMESNDNIAFYSTLKDSSDRDHRDVQITVTPEFSESLNNIIKHFETRYSVEYISDIEINED